MKRIRFNEEQIIGILRGQETGQKTADEYRRHGISSCFLNICAHKGAIG